jgi:thiamine-monophosphate kinase
MAYRSCEDALVRRISRRFPAFQASRVHLAAGDDAALWEARPGYETILTSDWFLEGSHFLRKLHPADAVGWKSLARAASDMAAMGGMPRCFLLNVALPDSCTGNWIDEFLRGLRRAARLLRCQLAGGDTTKNQRIQICLTVIGEVNKGRAVLRSGARPGDLLFVSGTLGLAELGLRQLRKGARVESVALRKHLYPEPRIALGDWLAENRLASAMMDISDGLSTDLARMCEASGVGAIIAEGALPGPQRISKQQAARLALHGGDDYELLFAVPAKNVTKLRKNFQGLPLTHIGAITETKQLLLTAKTGTQSNLVPGGWDPFRR